MGKIFGILFIVVGVWVGLEVYTEGVGGAFGGVLTRLPGVEARQGGPSASTVQRATGSVQRSYRETDERYGRMLDE